MNNILLLEVAAIPGWVETIGYVAMVLVGLSIMMNNIKLLRILNMAGAVAFVLYGGLIGSLPVVLLNSFLTLVNFFYLYRDYNKKKKK